LPLLTIPLLSLESDFKFSISLLSEGGACKMLVKFFSKILKRINNLYVIYLK
jgi:hypothetical protein